MKRIVYLIALLALCMPVVAQEVQINLRQSSIPAFGISAMLPDRWASAGPGVFARGDSPNDATALIIQSAPLAVDQLVLTLLPRLGQDSLPEPLGQIAGQGFAWNEYLFEVEAGGLKINVSLALAEADGTTYLVILQTTSEEHDALHDQVFVPCVESVMPLIPEQTIARIDLPYVVEDVQFTSGDLTISGTITKPEGTASYAAVVLISGSGPSDRDESLLPLAEMKPFAILADHLTRNGYLVLRYDDRGVGESEGDYASATLEDFAADAIAAVNYLMTRSDVRKDAIGILGHSEGGAIAPLVAVHESSVSFVIGLAAPTIPLYDVIRTQNQRLFSAVGASPEVLRGIDEYLAAIQQAFAMDDEEALRISVAGLIELQTGEMGSDQIIDLAISQFRSYDALGYMEFDPGVYWQQVEQPVLAIYGSLDTQVDGADNKEVLETLLPDPSDVTVLLFGDANHLFQIAESGLPQEYSLLDQSMNPEVLDAITSWLDTVNNGQDD